MNKIVPTPHWPGDIRAFSLERLPARESFKARAYAALKDAIAQMNIYAHAEPIILDERDLSERLGASRTPIREAVAMLEQEGLVKTLPRRGILVVRRSKREIVEMIEAWAALESMAARLITRRAEAPAVARLRDLFAPFAAGVHAPYDDYSLANIAFHQALIAASGSALLSAMTDNLFLHVRAIRHRAIFELDRAERSIADHLEIIAALEACDTERAERLTRDHTLRLAAHVERHVDLD